MSTKVIGTVICVCAILYMFAHRGMELPKKESVINTSLLLLLALIDKLPGMLYTTCVNYIEKLAKLKEHDGSVASFFKAALARFTIGIVVRPFFYSARTTIHVAFYILILSFIFTGFDVFNRWRKKYNKATHARMMLTSDLHDACSSGSTTRLEKTRIGGKRWTRVEPVITRSRSGALSRQKISA